MKNILKTFFHRKPRENKHKSWDDISIKQFYQLVSLGDNPSMQDLFRIIYNVDYNTLTLKDINSYHFDFLKHPIPRRPIRKTYTLNNTVYSANFELPSISAAQFLDFRNYSKQDDFVGCLSTCLIPKGHEYNEDYDILIVKQDIETMPITEAQTISFFFANQLAVLLKATLQSSTQQLSKTNPELTNLLSKIDNLDLPNLI